MLQRENYVTRLDLRFGIELIKPFEAICQQIPIGVCIVWIEPQLINGDPILCLSTQIKSPVGNLVGIVFQDVDEAVVVGVGVEGDVDAGGAKVMRHPLIPTSCSI